MSMAIRATQAATGTTAEAGSAMSGAGVAGGALGKDAFMKLLITQLKNQDPLSPQDGTQMATQLATFTSVETLQSINSKLDGLTAAVKASQIGSSTGPGTTTESGTGSK